MKDRKGAKILLSVLKLCRNTLSDDDKRLFAMEIFKLVSGHELNSSVYGWGKYFIKEND